VKEKLKAFFSWGRTVLRIFLGNHCSMHAAGLTYYSMLALVPILCIVLLVARSFGAHELAREKVHEQFEAMIVHLENAQDDGLATLTAADEETREEKRRVAQEFANQARGMEAQVIESIEKIDIGTLGWIGFLMLVWTVLSSIGMIEVSFNEIWSVTKARPFWRRMLLNALVLMVLPLLSGLALTAPVLKIAKDVIVMTVGATWLTKWISDGAVWLLDLWVLRAVITLLFSSLAFAFLFAALPNCRIRWKYAWWSGLGTAALFAGWLKICTVAQVGIAKTSALYGSLAFLPIMLAWLYMSWQIVLLGCCAHRATQMHAAAPSRSRAPAPQPPSCLRAPFAV